MSNTPHDGEPQHGSAPQPGSWGQPAEPAADATRTPGPAAPAWGAPSGYGAPAGPASPGQGTPTGWDAPAGSAAGPGSQGGWDAPVGGAPDAGAAPAWDQPASKGSTDWAREAASQAGQQGSGMPAYGAPGAGGYAVNYAVPVGLQGGLDGATHPDDLTRPLYGATFGQALKRLFRNYVNFNGRASRSEFWWVMLAMFLLELIPSILYSIGAGQVAVATLANTDSHGIVDSQAVAASAGGAVALMGLGGALIGLIGLGLLLPLLGLFWRRLHDGNFSGLFFLLCLVPGVGALVVLILCALESKPEGRRFDVAPGYAAY